MGGRRAGLGLARAAAPPCPARARRHRVLVAGLAAALLAAVAALAVGGVLVARQRDRAEQNLAFARTVVDEMYTQVALELEQSERALPEQRLILEKAVRFYQRFAVPQSRDPAVLFEAARAGLRLGKIQRWLKRVPEGGEGLARCAGHPVPPGGGPPGGPRLSRGAVQAHSDIGESLLSLLRGAEGVPELATAAEIYAELADSAQPRADGMPVSSRRS